MANKDPPSSFSLKRTPEKNVPGPFPPKLLKSSIYSTPEKFNSVDRHAFDVAKTNYSTCRHLLYNLVGTSKYSALEKTRLIFRWVTARDFTTLQFKSSDRGSIEEAVLNFKNKRSNYATLFSTLCESIGLPCVVINGLAKGAEMRPGTQVYQYHVGSKIVRPAFSHAWNAVLIEGSWQLVDCHWAARYIKTEHQDKENLIYDYDDYYFLTEPSQLIYSHFPDSPDWQLLAKPVKQLGLFEILPVAKSHHFKNGMEFWSHGLGVINCPDGFAKITLGSGRGQSFTYKICNAANFEESFRGTPLCRFVYQEMTSDHVNFYFRAPVQGSYYLNVFVQRPGGHGDTMKQMFHAACEYKLVCERAAADPAPYPECADTAWGPTSLMQDYNLVPSIQGGFVPTEHPTTQIQIDKTRPTQLIFKLTRPGMNDTALEQNVQLQDSPNKATAKLTLPEKGEYGVEVYACDPEKDRNVFTHVGQYLVRYGDSAYPPGTKESEQHHKQSPEPDVHLTPDQISQERHNASKEMSPDSTAEIPYIDGDLENDIKRKRFRVKPKRCASYPSAYRIGKLSPTLHNDADVVYYKSLPGLSSFGTSKFSNEKNDSAILDAPPPTRSNSTSIEDFIQQKLVPDRFNDTKPTPGLNAGLSRSDNFVNQPAVLKRKHFPGLKIMDLKQRKPFSGVKHMDLKNEAKRMSLSVDRDSETALITKLKQRSASIDPVQLEYQQEMQQFAQKPGYEFVGEPTASPEEYQAAPDPYYRAPDATKERWKDLRRKFSIRSAPADNKPIAAPANFQLDPVDRKDQPQAQPTDDSAPLMDCYELHKDLFADIDEHARRVALLDHPTFRDLIWQLLYQFGPEATDLEKVRAIFLWLCSKNLKDMRFDNVAYNSPEEALMKLRDGDITYSLVFETLCRYGGIHCVTVPGHAKGVDYRPGMHFGEKDGQHSWNAVLVDKQWRLIDCHWAARRIVGKKQDENIQYALDEFYFCTAPKQLIYTHFPHDPNWQLLQRSITLDEFEKLPPVKPLFFRTRLEMISHRHAVIQAEDSLVVQIGTNRYAGHGLDFSTTLAYEDGREAYRGTKLSQYALQEVIGNIVLFRFRFPEAANYRLTLFVRECAPDEQPQDKGMYSAAIEYGVHVTSAEKNLPPYPPCSGSNWGFSEINNRYKLTPSDRHAVMCTQQGECQVSFKTVQATLFMCKLRSANYPEDELKKHVVQRTCDDTTVFGVSVPSRGEYGLEIFANDPAKDGKTLFHMCQYLITCDEDAISGLQFPQLPPSYLGAQPQAATIGLKAVSHADPYINTANDHETIVFRMNTPGSVRLTSNLIRVKTGVDVSEFVLHQTLDTEVTLVVRLPDAGMYKLQIYGQSADTKSTSIPAVFNYLIHSTGTASKEGPFPKQYQQWKDGCYLFEPTDGHLIARGDQRFRVTVPSARKVAVVVGETWHQLAPQSGDVWEALIDTTHSKKISLIANFGGDEGNFSTLLEYNV